MLEDQTKECIYFTFITYIIHVLQNLLKNLVQLLKIIENNQYFQKDLIMSKKKCSCKSLEKKFFLVFGNVILIELYSQLIFGRVIIFGLYFNSQCIFVILICLKILKYHILEAWMQGCWSYFPLSFQYFVLFQICRCNNCRDSEGCIELELPVSQVVQVIVNIIVSSLRFMCPCEFH